MSEYTKKILDIEDALSVSEFQDIKIGKTLRDVLRTEILKKDKKSNIIQIIKIYIRYQKHYIFKQKSKEKACYSSNKILFTLLNDSPRLAEIVLPIIENIGKDNSCLIYSESSAKKVIPEGLESIPLSSINDYSVTKWRRKYKKVRLMWKNEIDKIGEKYSLNISYRMMLEFSMMISAKNVFAFYNLLKKINPKIIVTDYDHNEIWSSLIMVANKLNIPTVALVHGNMGENAIAYYPLLANYIICWGEMGKAMLIDAGEKDRKIFIGGSPKFKNIVLLDKKNTKVNLNYDIDKSIVVFAATNDINEIRYIIRFCDIIERSENVKGIVRLHPNSCYDDFTGIAIKYNNTQIVLNNKYTIDQTLAIADAFVCHKSAMAIDIIIKKCPLIIFDDEVDQKGDNRYLIEYAEVPHAKSDNELKNIIDKIIYDETYKKNILEKNEIYQKNICYAFESDAAILSAEIINKIIKEQKSDAI